jgi:hypothetical protein
LDGDDGSFDIGAIMMAMPDHLLYNINEGVTVNFVDPLMTVDGTLEMTEMTTARMRSQFLSNQELEGILGCGTCTQLFQVLCCVVTVTISQHIESLLHVHRREGFCAKMRVDRDCDC